MPVVRNVLIVGGGIAGLTLAIGLKRAGISTGIVEINPEWTVSGLGLSLQAPALRAFNIMGLLDQCVESGFGYSYFCACDVNGNVTGTVQMPKLNGPDYPSAIGIMRQRLYSLLREVLAEARVPVDFGVSVASLREGEKSVAVNLTNGKSSHYDLVVGADGAHSRVRELLFGTGFQPKYTGQAVWRATVPRPTEIQARYSFYGPRNMAGFNPVSDKQMYIYLVQNLPEFMHLAEGELVAVIREQLSDFGGPMAHAREQVKDPNQVVYKPIASGLLPVPWFRGRTVLIGDAAHTVTPHLAAGAGIAIEDSIVLTQVLQSAQSLGSALETFMARRFERCRLVVENSFLLGEWDKMPNTPGADPVGVLERSLKALAAPF